MIMNLVSLIKDLIEESKKSKEFRNGRKTN